jgi:hypothetical protein
MQRGDSGEEGEGKQNRLPAAELSFFFNILNIFNNKK